MKYTITFLNKWLEKELNQILNDYKYYNINIELTENNKFKITKFQKPIVDDWNVGHYGITKPIYINKDIVKYYNIKELYFSQYKDLIEPIFKYANNLNLDKLKKLSTKEVYLYYKEYKDIVKDLQNLIYE